MKLCFHSSRHQTDRQIEDKGLDRQTGSVRLRKSPSFVIGPADVCSSSSLAPPPSLSSHLSRWFKVHVEVRVPTSPPSSVTPCSLHVSVQQTPSGIDLFPLPTKTHTYTHMHTCWMFTACRCAKENAHAEQGQRKTRVVAMS